MTRSHKGNYAAKHPAGTQVDAALAQAVSGALTQGSIACKNAFAIARQLHIPPKEVGKAIDLAKGRIQACQLGLFGYGADEKRVQKALQVSDELSDAIKLALVDGRLHCRDAWRIADELGLSRIEVSRACEAIQIKIDQCQLGAF